MPEDFMQEHAGVFWESTRIFKERSRTRGQMWLETTISRELFMIDEKIKRAFVALEAGLDDPEMMKEFEDSLLDLNNFSAFAIKKARRGVRE